MKSKKMTSKQKQANLKTWRRIEKTENRLVWQRAKQVSGLVKKHGKKDTYDFLIRLCALKSASVQEYMRLGVIYDMHPNEKLWSAVAKVCVVQLAKIESEVHRKKIASEILTYSKKNADTQEGVVGRCDWRKAFIKFGYMEAAETGRCHGKKRNAEAKGSNDKKIKAERDLAISALANLMNGGYSFLRKALPKVLVQIVDKAHPPKSIKKTG